jgi:hypothetical protein
MAAGGGSDQGTRQARTDLSVRPRLAPSEGQPFFRVKLLVTVPPWMSFTVATVGW